VEIGILGPLEVRAGGQAVQITGSRLRALVTRLALDAPATVSTAELLDAVWSADAPAEPLNALQSLISRVRRVLGDAGLIQQLAGGYRLAVDRGAVDVAAFTDLVAAGRRELRDGTPQTARDLLVKGLSLWRGTPLADAGDAAYAVAPSVRLVERRLDAQADLMEAELQLGRGVDVIADLEALAAANPLRERFAGQLMRALAATGRTADALAVFDRIREQLANELGVDPGTELQTLQLSVLRGEIPAESTSPSPPEAQHRRRSNLRAPLTSFIGREDEVARVSELLETGRLVTIVGPGGAGKTRLANEIASRWIPRRSDGVWLIELAPVTDEKAIAQAMLSALGLVDTRAVERRVERPARDTTEHLFDVLAEADCVLLVDNCEHLIGPVASLIDQLLARCPDLRILTTSREPLGIVGEALCVLPPLGLPPVGVRAAEAETHPAVQLLVERAQAVSAGFVVDDSTVDHVTEIVRRLDGLPLAIELAAARLRVMPIGEIAAKLSDRFRLLTGGSRTAMPRHRTLRAVVEWSWDLLGPEERLLAERLAVFPAGATEASAIAVCGDNRLPAALISDLLLSLVDKSLLDVIDGATVRYRMLETIREYGTEQLAERGEAQAARIAHAKHFATVAREADPVLRTAGQLTAIAVLGTERDNIFAAIRFLAESTDPADRAASLDLALSMTWYWTMIGANAEAAAWLGLALSATDGTDHPGRSWARAARALASISGGGEMPLMSWTHWQAALHEMSDELESAPAPPVPALQILAPMLAFFSGDNHRSERLMEQTLSSDDGWVRAAARIGRAGFAENEGDMSRMREDVNAAYVDFSRIGDRWGLASVLTMRGNARSLDGDVAGAIDDHEQALRYANELGSTDDDTLIQLRLAGLRLRAGDSAGARKAIEALRADMAERSQGWERDLFADAALLGIVLRDGDQVAAAAMATDLRERLGERPVDFLHGHAMAIVGGMTALVAMRTGDIPLAMADLIKIYPIALATKDMPVVANAGVCVAALAEALGRSTDAAEILGAAARLRGSDDATEPIISDVTTRLRARLGRAFDENYSSGRALDREGAIARIDPGLLVAVTSGG
jgi:predicted ATPase/DNA-binding SARP family transcriptional activator